MTNTIMATQEITDILLELQRVRDYKDQVKKQEEYLVQRLYNLVNEHEEIITVDEHGISKTLATWKYAKDAERFDAKSLKESNPNIYQLYVKITPGARTLRIAK